MHFLSGEEDEEKSDHNRVRKWRLGIRKTVWVVWRGMTKGKCTRD